MLNKIDKMFIISSIFILVLLVLSLLVAILSMFDIGAFWMMIFGSIITITLLVIPISIVVQTIILFVKIFSRNKTKKDWIIIFANMLLILAFSGLAILAFLSTLNPLI